MPSTPEVQRQQRAAMRVRGPGRPRSDRTEEQQRESKRINALADCVTQRTVERGPAHKAAA